MTVAKSRSSASFAFSTKSCIDFALFAQQGPQLVKIGSARPLPQNQPAMRSLLSTAARAEQYKVRARRPRLALDPSNPRRPLLEWAKFYSLCGYSSRFDEEVRCLDDEADLMLVLGRRIGPAVPLWRLIRFERRSLERVCGFEAVSGPLR